jgi:hypothetical protein
MSAILLATMLSALADVRWPAPSASAQQAPPARNAPVLAWYYPQFSQGAAQDVAIARRAGVDALIVSQTTQLPGVPLFTSPIAQAAQGTDLALTLGIETNVVYDSQDQLVTELQRILRDEAPNPRFLRFRGKPVIVFWQLPAIKTLPGQTPQAAWASVRAQVDPGRTSLWIGEGGDSTPGTGTLSYLSSFDALHLYSIAWDADPGRALDGWARRTRAAPGNLLWVATVMPGGSYADGPPPWKNRGRENGAYFERAWQGALATNPDMIILTSLNEDNEGSAIHPRPEWGDLYVNINKRYADQYHAQHGDSTVTAPIPVPPTPTPVRVAVAPPQAGASKTEGSAPPDTPTTLSLQLATGKQASVTLNSTITGVLRSAQPDVASARVQFDVAPPVSVPVQPAVYGGGQVAVVDSPLDIRVGLRDAAGNAIDPTTSVGEALVELTLPFLPPADPNAQFHWLYEVLDSGGNFVGYAWSPSEVVDPATGTVTLSLSLSELQGTIFLPTSITPGYVQNFDPLVHVWSGPTLEARDFGLAGPQFTTFTVVAPQIVNRLFVFSPVVNNYAWIDSTGVGPSGPPQ